MPLWESHVRAASNTTIISSISTVMILNHRTRSLVTTLTFHSLSLVYSKSYWPYIISIKAIAFSVHCRFFHSLWQLSGEFEVSIHLHTHLSSLKIIYNLSHTTSLLMTSKGFPYHQEIKPKSLHSIIPDTTWLLTTSKASSPTVVNPHCCFIFTYVS